MTTVHMSIRNDSRPENEQVPGDRDSLLNSDTGDHSGSFSLQNVEHLPRVGECITFSYTWSFDFGDSGVAGYEGVGTSDFNNFATVESLFWESDLSEVLVFLSSNLDADEFESAVLQNKWELG
jgi:hypothetical protein